MLYVFDSNSFINLFHHYYPDRFPTLWKNFNILIKETKITSVREVYNEIGNSQDNLSQWAKEHKKTLFPEPTYEEFKFVSLIFQIPHFQAIIRKKERLSGKPVADPFIIAKAKTLSGCVVTEERSTPNAARIPNICEYFKIDYTNLEGFMKIEDWKF
jgi:hypothetical protein